MKTPLNTRSLALAALAAGFALAGAGCGHIPGGPGGAGGANEGSKVAGHSGPGAPSGAPISNGGGPAHDPATNVSHVGPANAGPAGSQ